MREIKFRAWDRIGKRMLNWGEVLQLNLQNIFRNICGMTLLQYTGIGGIYEGDILVGYEYGEYCTLLSYWYGEVYWSNEMAGFYVRALGPDDDNLYTLDDYHFDDVYGNIYENPELLEGERC